MGRYTNGKKGTTRGRILITALCLIGLIGLAYDSVEVIRVVDGDTIKVLLNGEIETVRLVGVDTAECVKPGVGIQDGSLEASAYTKGMLTGKWVLLVYSEPAQDFFGRYLAYVYLVDTETYPAKIVCFNWMLIENGYSDVYTKYKFKFREQFIGAFE